MDCGRSAPRLPIDRLRGYVDLTLERAPGRMERLAGFLDNHCAFDPEGFIEYAAVFLSYSVWCRAHFEECRDAELRLLLEGAAFPVVRSVVLCIALKSSPEPWDAELNRWWPAGRVTKETGVPAALLQVMRENGCGPRWRARGHSFFYCVTSLREWLAGGPDGPDYARLISAFVAERCEFAGEHWESCAGIARRCLEWASSHGNINPRLLRSELRAQLIARGLRQSHHQDANRADTRVWWGVQPASKTAPTGR
jgi:hypothetical protein